MEIHEESKKSSIQKKSMDQFACITWFQNMGAEMVYAHVIIFQNPSCSGIVPAGGKLTNVAAAFNK